MFVARAAVWAVALAASEARADNHAEVALAGLRSARQAIHTLTVKIDEITDDQIQLPKLSGAGIVLDPPGTRHSLEWAETPDAIWLRTTSTVNKQSEELVLKADGVKSLSRALLKKGVHHGGSLDTGQKAELSRRRDSPWAYGLFVSPVEDRGWLDEELARPDAVCTVQTVDGRPCYRFTRPLGKGAVLTAELDPARNFLPRAVSVQGPPGGTDSVSRVTEFAEPKPGVYFPVRVTKRLTWGGKPARAARVEMTGLVVNEAVPDGRFQLTFPVKTLVHDRVRDVKYVTDADEQPRPNSAPRPSPPLTRPAETDPWYRRPLVLLLAVCGVAAAAVAVYRRRRSAGGG